MDFPARSVSKSHSPRPVRPDELAPAHLYPRASWYDRNSTYNNYFNNLSTGEWFKFVSRQAAVDHVYVVNASTVLNVRYGYNWFVRAPTRIQTTMASI